MHVLRTCKNQGLIPSQLNPAMGMTVGYGGDQEDNEVLEQMDPSMKQNIWQLQTHNLEKRYETLQALSMPRKPERDTAEIEND
jgi:hypothetical protein